MSSRVCVTGADGYIGSWLVKKLLGRGCVVHATLRNLGDEGKTGRLRALPGAAERLRLFQADIYDVAAFEPAIAGCEFVSLVASPMLRHTTGSSKVPMHIQSKTLSEYCCTHGCCQHRHLPRRPWAIAIRHIRAPELSHPGR